MNYSDDPVADQATNDKAKAKLARNIEGILRINDVLGTWGPVQMNDGSQMDAVVNVVISQQGTNDLTIESFEIKDDIVDITNSDGAILYTEYDAAEMFEFTSKAEEISLTMAKNTPEESWSYRLLE